MPPASWGKAAPVSRVPKEADVFHATFRRSSDYSARLYHREGPGRMGREALGGRTRKMAITEGRWILGVPEEIAPHE